MGRRFCASRREILLSALGASAGCIGSATSLQEDAVSPPDPFPTGTWTSYRGNAENNGRVTSIGGSKPEGSIWEHELDNTLANEILFEGEELWATDHRGRVVSLDAATGDRRWATSIDDVVTATPAVDTERVYVAAGTITAISRTDGDVIWSESVPGAANSPTVHGSTVYTTRPYSGGITARQADSGKSRWQRPTPATSHPPAVNDNGVFVTGGNTVYGFSLDGESSWKRQLPARATTPPVVTGDRAYLGLSDRSVARVDLATGDLAWHAELGAGTTAVFPPAVAENGIVAVDEPGTVHYLSFAGDHLDKTSTSGPTDQVSRLLHHAPTVSSSRAIVHGRDRRLYVYSLGDEAISRENVWEADHRPTATPIVTGEVVFLSGKYVKAIVLSA